MLPRLPGRAPVGQGRCPPDPANAPSHFWLGAGFNHPLRGGGPGFLVEVVQAVQEEVLVVWISP